MIICRYVSDSQFIRQMFHIQTELINRSYPQKGIKMYSEIIENGGLLFFANFSDIEKFFQTYLESNKKGYDFLISSKECKPTDIQGMLQSSIQVTCDLTSPEISKEKIVDLVTSTYEKIAQHIASICKWGAKCTCMKVERLNPEKLLIYLRREEELRKLLSVIPFQTLKKKKTEE